MAAGVNLNPFSLDAVKPKQIWVLGVNNLNPFIIFCLDTKTNMADVRTFKT